MTAATKLGANLLERSIGLEPDRTKPHEIIGSVERTPAGNVALRIGEALEGGWHQVGYVVASPAEVAELVRALSAAVPEA